MALVAEPIPGTSREPYLKAWLTSTASNEVKAAALAYLAECGVVADLDVVRAEFESANHQTRQAAAEAILRINLRDSRTQAIAALYELQPVTVQGEILAEIFQGGVESNTVLDGLKHLCPGVRRICVQWLRSRKAFSAELADQLKGDADAAVRYEALSELTSQGQR